MPQTIIFTTTEATNQITFNSSNSSYTGITFEGQVAVAPSGPEGPQGPAGADGAPGTPGVVQAVVAGDGVGVDSTNPANPIVSADVESVNGATGAVVLDTDDISDTSTNRYTNDADVTRLANTSGTNTGDQTLAGLGGVPTTRTVNGHALSSDVTVTKSDVGLGNVDNTSDLGKPISTATQSALDLKQSLSEKGQADGYASLDNGGKVPVAQLPASVMTYLGTWNANTNTPTLINGTGDSGDLYIVSVAGTHNFGAGDISFEIGDWVMYNGSIWQRSDMSDAVSSVFGRQGAVTAQNGDYTASQVTNTPAGTISAVTAQGAIDELDTEKVPNTRTVNGYPLSSNITLAKGDVGLGNADNTSDATKNSAVATLTNKTFGNDTIFTESSTNVSNYNISLENSSPTAISPTGINFRNTVGLIDTSRISSNPGTGYLNSSLKVEVADSSKVLQTRMNIDVAGVITIPTAQGSATNVVATTDHTQTLTNKTINGSNNTLSNIAQSSVTNLVSDLASKLDTTAYDDATTAETNTGTSTAKYVSPDGLAGSYAGTKVASVYVIEAATVVTTGDGKAYLRINSDLNGMNLVSVNIAVITTSSSGLPTVQLARGRQSSATSAHTFADMLSTKVTIDATEYDSKDATTPAVIDTANDDVATGDLIRIDVDVAGTGTAGLILTLAFRLP